tara:strand:- start:2314 stop:3207 length:894 start_codon:yes stop_codon:yes gene_type:complete
MIKDTKLPEQFFPDWSRFISAVWEHGRSVKNMQPKLADAHVYRAVDGIKSSIVQRNESRYIRPSSFLSCARQAYFFLQGHDAGKMPDTIGSTFAVGHLLHELSYAAVLSAIPLGFKVHTEYEVALPEWWPHDHESFNNEGHVDMLIEIEDPALAAKYLPEEVIEASPKMLVDFKTMGGYSYRKHSKAIFDYDPDGFGYVSQLSTYASALGVEKYGAIIAGINRDQLQARLNTRLVAPEILQWNIERLKRNLEKAIAGQDPGVEFINRHKEEANFYCGKGGKPGYCPFKQVCKETPVE